MEESGLTKSTNMIAKFTVRPVRIPILIFLIAMVYKYTGMIYLSLTLAFMSLVFDMLFIMLTEQFKILNIMRLSLDSVGKILEDHEESINILETQE